MKKALTLLLSLVILISVCIGANTIAFAKDPIISPETTQRQVVIEVTLNGEESSHTSYKPDPNDKNVITFTYTGDGELKGWEFPKEIEGVDYEIVSQDGNSITIRVLNGFDDDYLWANAIEKEPTNKNHAKKDESPKSPKTGATISGLGIAGAGVAMLMIAKKKRQ